MGRTGTTTTTERQRLRGMIRDSDNDWTNHLEHELTNLDAVIDDAIHFTTETVRRSDACATRDRFLDGTT